MNIEARKKWAFGKDWKPNLPVERIATRTGLTKKVGQVWAYHCGGADRGVVLTLESDQALILAHDSMSKGEMTWFSEDSRLRSATLIENAPDDWSVGWEVDPVQPNGYSPRVFKVGDRWLVGIHGMDGSRKGGGVVEITKVVSGVADYARVHVVSADGVASDHGTGMNGLARLMRRVGHCDDLHTGYGLKCTLDRDHEGDEHQNARSGARWPVKRVVRLRPCATGLGHPGATPAAVAVIFVEGVRQDACEPCALAWEAKVASMTRTRTEQQIGG